MESIRALGAILLVASVCPLTAQTETPVLRLKSGRVPPNQLTMAASEAVVSEAAGQKRTRPNRQHLIVQFASYPTAAQMAELGYRDIRVLSYVPDNGLLVSTDTGADLSGLGLVYSAALAAEDKVSPLFARDGSAGVVVAVVELYGDSDPSAGRQLALAEGLEVVDSPDLTAAQLMVRGSVEQLLAAAGWDEVSYIYPAAGELQRGEPVMACTGGALASADTQAAPLAAAASVAASFGDGWDGPGLGSASLAVWWGAMPPRLDAATVKAQIERALAAWSATVKVDFSAASTAKLARQIEISFMQKSHGDGFDFDGVGGVLAHTFYPPPNAETLAGDLHFDISENWQVGADIDVFSVALHELGHALGLGHNDDPSAVMYAFYRKWSGLQTADVTEIRKMYAAVAAASGSTPSTPSTPSVPSTPAPTTPTAPTAPTTPTTPTTPTAPATPAAPTSPSQPPPDAEAPKLTLTSPSSATYSTTASSLTVTGVASDNVAVTKVTWSTNAGVGGSATGTASFSTGPIPLMTGKNTILVRAYDAASNNAFRTITVTRR